MNALIVFAVIFGSLFCLAYFTKRRFGVLGLALCAGALLSGSWTGPLTPLVAQQGINLVSPPLSLVVAVGLTLLPAGLLLLSGPTYTKPLPRTLGSLMFALLALVFLLVPLGSAVAFEPSSLRIYDSLVNLSNVIIVAGIAMAVIDILLTRAPKRPSKRSEH